MAHRFRFPIVFLGMLAASISTAETGNLKHPDWHPDGRHLVSEGSCTGNVGLYLVDTDSGTVKLLFDSDYTDGYPRWFADGNRIAFHQFDGRRNSRIHLASVTLAGEVSDVEAITEGPYDIEPAPSPDGKHLVYSAKGEYGQDIAWLDFDRDRTKVWDSKYAENFPSWHPDGESIVFHGKIKEETHLYRRLLSTYQISKLTETDLGNEEFRWLTGKEISVAGVNVRALRVNYVGELGWELHPDINDLEKLYDAIWDAGSDFGIANFGLYAVNSLRIEKAYRGWGAELTNEVTMLEADMERFIKLDKDSFTGREATIQQMDSERVMQLVYFEVELSDSDVRGGEPIFSADECIGVTTSGGFGHSVGKSLGFGYVSPDFAASGTEFLIGLLGDKRSARVLQAPAYDPKNERLRV